MDVLIYENLNPGPLEDKVNKVIRCLSEGDFQTADVKKMGNGYYRAKLDYTNRLLFDIARYEDKSYIFILEVIHNHAYERSKFLNGTPVDESKLSPLDRPEDIQESTRYPVSYINPRKKTFRLLDKILFFDDVQEQVLHVPAPCIIIGSAGSGKTSLTLEKIKLLKGNILYVTLSPFLARNAGTLYASYGFENKEQKVSFLSYYEYLCTISIPIGKEVDFVSFERWLSKYRQSYKIKDAYGIYEEIKGVITGSDTAHAHLTLEEYMGLGIRQSIFEPAQREQVFALFIKYKSWIAEEVIFDSNIASFERLGQVRPTYDYVVVDEVQDLTAVQLSLILKSLREPSRFFLCGDANQIVHPNFFSWAQIKSMLYKQQIQEDIVTILARNYRNTPEVTALANQLLLIKIARFGSIDKESNHLVIANSNQKGDVEYLEHSMETNRELNEHTRLSAKFAVLVLRNEDKSAARQYYSTPLLFSIHEAKGLEYDNIILFNPISTYEAEFRELTNGVTKDDLDPGQLSFSRARDKSDKSLEAYKFYVNALYVGITRAVKNLYIVEKNHKHPLLELLGLADFSAQSSITSQSSSKDEWQQEARRLEKQGKTEQAEAIREQILQIKPVPWPVIDRKAFPELRRQALNPEVFNKKSKDKLLYMSIYYSFFNYAQQMADLKHAASRKMVSSDTVYLSDGNADAYCNHNVKAISALVEKYGVDFRNEVNFTPLMSAVLFDSVPLMDYLLDQGADISLQDTMGLNVMQRYIYQIHKYYHARQQVEGFNRFYLRIRPESMSVKIHDQLFKISSQDGEFLILNYMVTTMYIQIKIGCDLLREDYELESIDIKPGFRVADMVQFAEGLSEQVLPEYKCKPTYISSILSKNEVNRKDFGSKQLFVRLKQGLYVPNPVMEVKIEGEWVNVYDRIPMEDIWRNLTDEGMRYIDLIRKFRAELEANPEAILDPQAYWAG
jgi:hypothetical protein